MKILYRNTLVWNLILFVMFSLLLVHIASAVSYEESAFSTELARKSLLDNKWLVGFLALTGLAIFRLNKLSKLLFATSTLFVIGNCIQMLTFNFNKILLILIFFYILISYFYYQFLKIELAESYYNANFYKNRLFDPMLYKIKCTIEFGNKSTKNVNQNNVVNAHLTNWNENGCFVILSEQASSEEVAESSSMPKLKGKVLVNFVIDGKKFQNSGLVVSQIFKSEGIGIKFYDESNSIYNWDNFYKIIENQGLTPEYVG